MTETTTPGDQQPEGYRLPKQGFQRIFATLFSPGEAFQDIAWQPTWVLPTILIIIIGIVGSFIIFKRLDPNWSEVSRDAIEMSLQKQGKSLSQMSGKEKEMMENQITLSAKIASYAVYIGPILAPLFSLIMALIFWGSASLMGGITTFNRIFSITVHIQCVIYSIVLTTLNVIVVFLRNPKDIDFSKGYFVASNLGALLPSDTNKFLIAFGHRLDLFTIWFLILMTIGLSKICKNLSRELAIAAVFGVWMIYVFVATILGGLFS